MIVKFTQTGQVDKSVFIHTSSNGAQDEPEGQMESLGNAAPDFEKNGHTRVQDLCRQG